MQNKHTELKMTRLKPRLGTKSTNNKSLVMSTVDYQNKTGLISFKNLARASVLQKEEEQVILEESESPSPVANNYTDMNQRAGRFVSIIQNLKKCSSSSSSKSE
mmetsp:Transcript_14576/g.16833  ORF Transcript_14576/g.16833 Transcript_14576/m.16833 type:complete len:104 (+) Transcript_14576:707-1018(+)